MPVSCCNFPEGRVPVIRGVRRGPLPAFGEAPALGPTGAGLPPQRSSSAWVVLTLLLCGVSVPATGWGQAASIELRGTLHGQGRDAALTLAWPAGAPCAPEATRRDLVVRCNGPVVWHGPDERAIRGAWVEGVRVGYDTVLVTASASGTLALTTTAEGVRAAFVPASSSAQPDDSGARRLDLLRVQWLVFEGRYGEANQVLEALGRRAPTDPDVLVARGRFDAERGRLVAADRQYVEALIAAPTRADIARLVAERARERAPRLSVQVGGRTISEAWSERSERVMLEAVAGAGTPLLLIVDRLRITAPHMRAADGRVVPLDTELVRFEGSATLAAGADTGITGMVFGTSDRVGGGASVVQHDLRGSSKATVEIGRPFWDFLEAAADGGRRDRVSLERQWRFRADMAAWVVADWNRYRLASGAGASSRALTLGVIRTVRHTSPTITVQYGLDKEHRQRATLVGDGDTAFAPIPLSSREVHLFGVVSRTQMGRLGELDASAGYTADRLGGHGAFLTARLTPRPAARAGLEVWLDRRLYTIVTTQRVLGTGARLAVRF